MSSAGRWGDKRITQDEQEETEKEGMKEIQWATCTNQALAGMLKHSQMKRINIPHIRLFLLYDEAGNVFFLNSNIFKC